ncbi:MAG: hypothetical protein CM1200mP12_03210 [Gammaproteobacteria bacterium]|nr:MAG: hypothetical protein CM1200mP12_03210 [Gammaproteobacteria bacterium]
MPESSPKPIVLDRDGVINEDLWGYVTKKEEFKTIEGSLLAIKKLTDAGFNVVIATNQACISKKIINEKQLQEVHDHMSLLVQEAGGKIDHVAFCPHTPEEKCSCRKPETGLLDEIEERLGCSLKIVFLLGTKNLMCCALLILVAFLFWLKLVMERGHYLQSTAPLKKDALTIFWGAVHYVLEA